jgi:predicted PurR-regulated permease PerM
MMVIPFVGSVAAIIPPMILALMTGDWLKVILVFIGLMALQQLVFNVIAPKVMSDSVGMHPLLVFAALLLGTKEAGIWGAIFGVPIVGVMWSMFVQFNRERKRFTRELPLITAEREAVSPIPAPTPAPTTSGEVVT